MRHLLVALDYTGCAWEVADVASDLAAKLGAQVTLLAVVHLPEGIEPALVLHGDLEGHTAVQALDEDARAALQGLAQVFVDRGIEPRVALRHGDVCKRILETRQEVGADMIITGTHGRTGLSRVVMGSIAEKVIRQAQVPVLTVRTLSPQAHPGLTPSQIQVLAEADG